MAYIALYRNYRPTTFSEVAGQKYIIKTLKNGVINNKISHAYIFSGQRGIGKTTIARILAKAVNCLEPVNGEPCNHCKNCLSIINNETSDIVEIDAASNNGVDEMRDLLEKVNFLPSTLKKKVYIIDEVHMLSISAFNALLKTLEEPPAHVMFVLATTEPHKIPMTILSRCQRFDFKQLSNDEIVRRLTEICEKEDILIDDDALFAIAEASEGGMRDAISILDQVSAYAESAVTIEDVDNVTGKISNYKLTELIKSFLNNDAIESLKIVNELLEIGKEPSRIINNLVSFCRDILLYKNAVTDEEHKKTYDRLDFKNLADEIEIPTLFYYIDVLMDASNKIKYTNSSKLYLEVAIMKIISSSKDELDVNNKIIELEERLKGQGGVALSTDYEVRLAETELKIKKITEELNRLNLEAFKEATTGKLAMLEDISSNSALIPDSITDKVDELENAINQLRTAEYNIQSMYRDLVNRINGQEKAPTTQETLGTETNQVVSSEVAMRIDQLEEYIKGLDLTKKEDTNLEPLSKRLDDLEQLVIEEKTNTTLDQDEVMGELLERMNKIEKDYTSLVESKNNVEEEEGSQPVDELMSSLTELTTEVKTLEERMSLLDTKQVNNITVSPDISEYRNEVNVLKENYFTIINSLQKILGDKIYEEEDDFTKEAPNLVDVEEIKSNVLKDALDAIAVVKDEIDNKIKENKDLIFDLSQKYETLDQTEEIDKIKNKVDSLENQTGILANKVEEYKSLELTQKIEDIKKLTNDIKEYNLNLKVKYDELERQVKAINTKPQERSAEVVTPKPQIVTPAVKPLAEPIQPKPQPQVTIQPKVEPVKPTKPRMVEQLDDTEKVYNIKIVERILHESRTQEARIEKVKLVNEWSRIPNNLNNNATLDATACLLRDGTLTANGQTELLIVYPDASLCNHLMSTRVHREAREILKMVFGKDYDFMALPENTWQEKRKEYYSQYAIGISRPVLSPIKNPNLKAIVSKEEPKKEGTYERVSSFFGSNIIRKEE